MKDKVAWAWYNQEIYTNIMFLDIPIVLSLSKNTVLLSMFYLKMETESSLWNVVFCNINRMMFLDKDRTMDNVQKHNICTDVPSSQSFRS
jgi:hypothetical protein